MGTNVLTVEGFRKILLEEPYFSAKKRSLSAVSVADIPQLKLIADMGLDSIDVVALVMVVERDNKVRVCEDVVDKWNASGGTTQDFVDMVNTYSVPV